jgi:hypothetical protein
LSIPAADAFAPDAFGAGSGWKMSDAGVTVDSLTDGGSSAVRCLGLATMDLGEEGRAWGAALAEPASEGQSDRL